MLITTLLFELLALTLSRVLLFISRKDNLHINLGTDVHFIKFTNDKINSKICKVFCIRHDLLQHIACTHKYEYQRNLR